MTYNETYQQRPEASTPYPDWVGASPEDALGSVTSFNRDIDTLSSLINPADLPSQPDITVDWQSLFNAAPCHDSFPDTMSSSDGTIFGPISPTSDGTVVGSPAIFPLSDLKLPPAEGALIDHSPALYTDITFPFEPPALVPASHMQSLTFDANNGYDADGQFYSPEQPLSQHMLDVANAVVPGPVTGMEANVHEFTTFTSIAPPSPLPHLPPKHPQDVLVVEDNKPTCPARTKRPRVEDDNDSDSASEDDASPKRKRKQQDTTPRFACRECGKLSGRTHNRKVHYQTVHLGLRLFPCKEPGCDWAFKRKHDLSRHHQSAHTKLGSPRKAKNAKPGNSKKGKTIVKKDGARRLGRARV